MDSRYQIRIWKYRKSDLILKPEGVIIVGVDKVSPTIRRPQLPSRRTFIKKTQLVEYEDFVYIPSDQIPDTFVTVFKYPNPVAQKTLYKHNWGRMKRNYPYKGGK